MNIYQAVSATFMVACCLCSKHDTLATKEASPRDRIYCRKMISSVWGKAAWLVHGGIDVSRLQQTMTQITRADTLLHNIT